MNKHECGKQEDLAEATQKMMDSLNGLDVSALEYIKQVCDMLIASKSWKE